MIASRYMALTATWSVHFSRLTRIEELIDMAAVSKIARGSRVRSSVVLRRDAVMTSPS